VGEEEEEEEQEDLASVDRFERVFALLAFSIFFKGVYTSGEAFDFITVGGVAVLLTPARRLCR